MVSSGHDPVGSVLGAVRDALESGIRRAAEDLESKKFDLFTKRQAHRAPKKLVGDERRKGSLEVRFPVKAFLSSIFPNLSATNQKGSDRDDGDEERDESCSNCLRFAMTWSLLVDEFVQAIPGPFKSAKKCFKKQSGGEDGGFPVDSSPMKSKRKDFRFWDKRRCSGSENADKETLSLELALCYALSNLVQSIQAFDQGSREKGGKKEVCDRPPVSTSPPPLNPLARFDHLKAAASIIIGKKADVDVFLSNVMFARVGGTPPSLVGATSSVKDEGEEQVPRGEREEQDTSSPQKLASGLLNIPLSNVERLRSTLSTVSIMELIESIPQLGRSSAEHPDKKKLFSVQDFFQYTQAEGRRFFEELDRDGDGQVTLEDLEIAMRKRKLPNRYARDLMQRTRRHLFSKSIGWKQFLSLMEQKEPTILRAYTTLCLSKSGTLQKNQIVTSLRGAGLPASEDNAAAMMRYLNADTGQSISYSHFRNFMLLLPSERLEDDPRSIWFEAATVVAVPPPVEISAGSVIKSALAGGLASALSTSVMYPVDTMKTRVQASTLSFPELVSRLPQIGARGLYRGAFPAILGQFSSHGLRTGIFEATKLVLINVAPSLPEIQVQSLASFCSTVLGTAVRIPCEVLKQRLQAGLFDNVGEAIVGTFHQDGIKGFFRGTGATLCREVPFYVAGLCLYAEAKKTTQNLLNRDLEPWETVAVGALSGGLAAVITTPFDVMKTRMMTAPRGFPATMKMVTFSILRKEGPLGLFKGAVPRFFWIAPLGAMNFAGYELAKKAMDKNENVPSEQLREKKMAASG